MRPAVKKCRTVIINPTPSYKSGNVRKCWVLDRICRNRGRVVDIKEAWGGLVELACLRNVKKIDSNSEVVYCCFKRISAYH